MLTELEIDNSLAKSFDETISLSDGSLSTVIGRPEAVVEETKPIPAKTLNHQQSKVLSDIQVPVHVDIGTITIQANELIDLIPGNSFEFNFDPKQEVDLRVGSESIGRARFVEKDGALGIEVTKIGK